MKNGPIIEAGIRELKTHLSEYQRHIQAGESFTVNAHNRPVARAPWPRDRSGTAIRFALFDQRLRAGAEQAGLAVLP